MIYSIPKPISGACALPISLWSIKEVIIEHNEPCTQHLVGFIRQEGAGRVTSAIQSFDPEARIITTSSGRKYLLYDDAGWHDDAQYVWDCWKMRNNVRDEKDVTEQYIKHNY